MAINLFEKQCDKIYSKYSSNSPKGSALPIHQLVKLSITTDGSITSSDSKSTKTKKKSNSKSPYLTGDSVQLSRVTEKKLSSQHKKPSDIVSSFPLAANIYKANSDEFKAQKKGNKKMKKSVLTLPNAPTAVPQTCTVSDMNDSEYCNRSDDNRKLKGKKRLVAQNKKTRVRNKNYEFYDRDARYCSQMNINLDCSSTDMIKHFTGDGKRVAGKFPGSPDTEQEFNAHDVWAVLRNINRFQFRPSPPISEDSIHTPKKKKIRNRRRNNRKDTRVIETCRTEEFAYISSFEVDSKSPRSFSQSSSFDRITVIDKQDEFSEICKEFEKSVKPNGMKAPIRKNTRKNLKTIGYKEQNEVNKNENKKSNDCNKINASEGQRNGCKSPETLVAIKCGPKVVNPQKQSPNELSTAKKSDGKIKSNAYEFDCSLCSESSKGISATRMDNKLPKVSSDESSPNMKGITKVVLSKGQSLMQTKKNDIVKRNLRQGTTVPSSVIMPKLTQTEIKRRLANLKFPIVILGKDQLSTASIHVMNNDAPHLEGLTRGIWPFMQDWYTQANLKSETFEKVHEKSEEGNLTRNKLIERKNNLRKINEINSNKPSCIKDKNCLNSESSPNKKKTPKRPLHPNEVTKIKQQPTKKPKPIHQLKDKMLKILYKNASVNNIDENDKTGYGDFINDIRTVETKISNAVKKCDVSTETSTNYEIVPHDSSKPLNISPRPDTKKMLLTKQPWAKARWASDFIENVINKIKSGIYFTQESKQQQNIPKIDLKEASIQTVLSGKNFVVTEHFTKEDLEDQNKTDCNEVSVRGANPFLENALPGFDDSLPALEIKTLNMKEVAVKYCTTNVMVQFDVAALSETDNVYPIKKSSSFVPLATTESHTKIFKCKTTILNAMLPAEICSLLPKIIRSIIDSNKPPPIPSTKFQNESLLYTISELSNSESSHIIKSAMLPVIPGITSSITSNLLKLLNGGVFSATSYRNSKVAEPKTSSGGAFIVTKDLLMDVTVQRLIVLNIDLISSEKPKIFCLRHIVSDTYSGNSISKTNSCTTLALYRERDPMITAILCNNRNMVGHLQSSNANIQLNITAFRLPLDIIFNHNGMYVTLNKKPNNNGVKMEGKATIITSFKVDSLYNGYMKHNYNTTLKAIEYKNKAGNSDSFKKEVSSKIRKKNSFVKLYKKCKSTSNISGERYSTSLSKITNLDDFFQALGSSKTLSSIFDGLSGKKILSSIIEMKNWITEINQRQAMLVLLLTNKKDTPNLVRFRPILLQGIAVNRITQATELDMEIEVIEREHFNKFSQYQGFPCLKEAVENQDNLMEELYWIAKTTASDYQKPFNEASEKLLKSLLEKRKKLNPSYLRVMARYVGLGLLKSPKN